MFTIKKSILVSGVVLVALAGSGYAKSTDFSARFNLAMESGKTIKMPKNKELDAYGLSGVIIQPDQAIKPYQKFKSCRQYKVHGLKRFNHKPVVGLPAGWVCKQDGTWKIEGRPVIIMKN